MMSVTVRQNHQKQRALNIHSKPAEVLWKLSFMCTQTHLRPIVYLFLRVCTYCSITARRDRIRRKQNWQHYSEQYHHYSDPRRLGFGVRASGRDSSLQTAPVSVQIPETKWYKWPHTRTSMQKSSEFKNVDDPLHHLLKRERDKQKSSRAARGSPSGIFFYFPENVPPLTWMFGFVINLICSGCAGFYARPRGASI